MLLMHRLELFTVAFEANFTALRYYADYNQGDSKIIKLTYVVDILVLVTRTAKCKHQTLRLSLNGRRSAEFEQSSLSH